MVYICRELNNRFMTQQQLQQENEELKQKLEKIEQYLLDEIQKAKEIMTKEPQMSSNWSFQLGRKDLAEMALLRL
jgi:AmiR/NasT family two-component response regulator